MVIRFSEDLDTASIILSQDMTGDGEINDLADVVGSVTVRDGDGKIINDVQLSYKSISDGNGGTYGELTIFKASLFDGSQHVSVLLSGDTTGGPALYDRSGLRSALRIIPGGDQAGTIFDGDADGVEGGNLLIEYGFSSLSAYVPAYEWYYGCSPTASAMLVGYYDGLGIGYDNLIEGDASMQTAAVKEAIASSGDGIYDFGSIIIVPATPGTGHLGDYALYDGVDDYGWAIPYPDLSSDSVQQATGVTPHADDCLADFIGTSRSGDGLTMGGSWPSLIGYGIEDYFAFRGYAGLVTSTYVSYGSGLTWDSYREEINSGRPVLLSVDSNGDGITDHSIIGIGYNLFTGEYEYYDTWDLMSHYAVFQSAQMAAIQGAVFGIGGGTFVEVAA
jgi:hypothetical protein